MKNIRARTKLLPQFKFVPIKILDEPAVITINGKIVSMGKKGIINGKHVRVCCASEKQMNFFIDFQKNLGHPLQYWGVYKDGFYFIYSKHGKFTHKGTAQQRHKNRKISDSLRLKKLYDDTENAVFTGTSRSGDIRFHKPLVKLKKKEEEWEMYKE